MHIFKLNPRLNKTTNTDEFDPQHALGLMQNNYTKAGWRYACR